MCIQLSAMLAPVVMYDRLRAADDERRLRRRSGGADA